MRIWQFLTCTVCLIICILRLLIGIGWSGFGQLVPLLASKDVSLVVGGGLYSGCVRGGVLRGGGAWPVGREGVVALRRAEMGVVGWMCGVKLKDLPLIHI